jgi:hypothetical protein
MEEANLRRTGAEADIILRSGEYNQVRAEEEINPRSEMDHRPEIIRPTTFSPNYDAFWATIHPAPSTQSDPTASVNATTSSNPAPVNPVPVNPLTGNTVPGNPVMGNTVPVNPTMGNPVPVNPTSSNSRPIDPEDPEGIYKND